MPTEQGDREGRGYSAHMGEGRASSTLHPSTLRTKTQSRPRHTCNTVQSDVGRRRDKPGTWVHGAGRMEHERSARMGVGEGGEGDQPGWGWAPQGFWALGKVPLPCASAGVGVWGLLCWMCHSGCVPGGENVHGEAEVHEITGNFAN